jgi:hypothetical protein
VNRITNKKNNKTWWGLLQKRVVSVLDEGYYRNVLWAYLMRVITETCCERTWWVLLQKRVVSIPYEGYYRDVLIHHITCTEQDKHIISVNDSYCYLCAQHITTFFLKSIAIVITILFPQTPGSKKLWYSYWVKYGKFSAYYKCQWMSIRDHRICDAIHKIFYL